MVYSHRSTPVLHRVHRASSFMMRAGGILFLVSLALLVINDPNNLESNPGHGRQLLALSASAKSRVERWHNMPRYDWTQSGKKVSSNLSGDREYQYGLGSLATYGVVLGLLSWLFGFTFLFSRCCCGCCGRKPAKEGYSSKTVSIHKFLWGFFFILIVVGMILAAVGSGKLGKGVVDVFDALTRAIDNVVNVINNDINGPLEVLDPGSGTASSGLTSASADIKKTLSDMKKTVTGVDDLRNLGSTVLSGVVILFALIGLFGALFGKAWLCWIMVVGTLFFLFFTWVLFGVHMAVAGGTSDVCTHIDLYVTSARYDTVNNLPPTITGEDGETKDVFSDVFPCIAPSQSNDVVVKSRDGAIALRDVVNNLLPDRRSSTGCSTTACPSLTFGPTQLDASVLDPVGAKAKRDSVTAEANTLKDALLTRSPALNGTAPTYNDQDPIIVALNQINAYVGILDASQNILGCNVAANAFETVQPSLCDTTLGAVEMLVIGYGLGSAAMMFGLIVVIRGSKRWQKGAQKDRSTDYELGAMGHKDYPSSAESSSQVYSADQLSWDTTTEDFLSSASGTEEASTEAGSSSGSSSSSSSEEEESSSSSSSSS